jgi:hypothetical protein
MSATYSHAVETRVEDATRILAHYVMMALPDADRGDTRAEMRTVVESILDAAILYVEDEQRRVTK